MLGKIPARLRALFADQFEVSGNGYLYRRAFKGLAAIFGLAAICLSASAAFAEMSPLETVERMHKALFEADPATMDALLHPDYHGLSLQGPLDHRYIFVESRRKAIDEVKHIKPGDWEVRFLKTETQIDGNGLAHVWARYVFFFKGKPDHCGHESYGLFHGVSGWKIISFADTDNALAGKSVAEVCPN